MGQGGIPGDWQAALRTRSVGLICGLTARRYADIEETTLHSTMENKHRLINLYAKGKYRLHVPGKSNAKSSLGIKS